MKEPLRRSAKCSSAESPSGNLMQGPSSSHYLRHMTPRGARHRRRDLHRRRVLTLIGAMKPIRDATHQAPSHPRATYRLTILLLHLSMCLLTVFAIPSGQSPGSNVKSYTFASFPVSGSTCPSGSLRTRRVRPSIVGQPQCRPPHTPRWVVLACRTLFCQPWEACMLMTAILACSTSG
jgi:hypothetical protein